MFPRPQRRPAPAARPEANGEGTSWEGSSSTDSATVLFVGTSSGVVAGSTDPWEGASRVVSGLSSEAVVSRARPSSSEVSAASLACGRSSVLVVCPSPTLASEGAPSTGSAGVECELLAVSSTLSGETSVSTTARVGSPLPASWLPFSASATEVPLDTVEYLARDSREAQKDLPSRRQWGMGRVEDLLVPWRPSLKGIPRNAFRASGPSLSDGGGLDDPDSATEQSSLLGRWGLQRWRP